MGYTSGRRLEQCHRARPCVARCLPPTPPTVAVVVPTFFKDVRAINHNEVATHTGHGS
ncbi:hypothetical protein DENSPDRAFT_843641 [Dentipellis sp. KUC8613]|nr:hypothetical protein DENSPDRAFT_840270 [Dentipellis sp. KUC8613]KAA1476623.1 hypothetical protein DENSPDRAFT_843641 [Dentipellis sp. KUC8613]